MQLHCCAAAGPRWPKLEKKTNLQIEDLGHDMLLVRKEGQERAKVG